MSGETEADPSGWTPDLIKQYVDRVLAERDLRYQQRFDAQQEALATVPPAAQQISQVATRLDGYDELMESKFVTYRTLIDSQAEKVALALAAADKSVDRTERDTDKRIEAITQTVSQLREALISSVRMDYMQQALEARDALIGANTERIRELELARSGSVGGQARVVDQRAFIATLVGVLGLLLTVVVVAANVLSSR